MWMAFFFFKALHLIKYLEDIFYVFQFVENFVNILNIFSKLEIFAHSTWVHHIYAFNFQYKQTTVSCVELWAVPNNINNWKILTELFS